MKKRKLRCLLFAGCLFIVGIAIFLCCINHGDSLEKIEKGDYSSIDDNRIKQQLNKIWSSSLSNNVKWEYEDLNKDGVEDLILEENNNKIIGVFTIKNNDVTIILWDDVDVTTYYELCDNGMLRYEQYYGVYGYEQYELYDYDSDWNERYIKGLELYDIEDASLVRQLDESIRLDRTGMYYLESCVHDKKKEYEELTEEEWLSEFSDLFGRGYHGDILNEIAE